MKNKNKQQTRTLVFCLFSKKIKWVQIKLYYKSMFDRNRSILFKSAVNLSYHKFDLANNSFDCMNNIKSTLTLIYTYLLHRKFSLSGVNSQIS